MLVSWPPGRGQTLSLAPPGIEPGLPASQAGTLPNELSRQLILWVVGASQLTTNEGSKKFCITISLKTIFQSAQNFYEKKEGSGSGSVLVTSWSGMPKNILIWIRNTSWNYLYGQVAPCEMFCWESREPGILRLCWTSGWTEDSQQGWSGWLLSWV